MQNTWRTSWIWRFRTNLLPWTNFWRTVGIPLSIKSRQVIATTNLNNYSCTPLSGLRIPIPRPTRYVNASIYGLCVWISIHVSITRLLCFKMWTFMLQNVNYYASISRLFVQISGHSDIEASNIKTWHCMLRNPDIWKPWYYCIGQMDPGPNIIKLILAYLLHILDKLSIFYKGLLRNLG